MRLVQRQNKSAMFQAHKSFKCLLTIPSFFSFSHIYIVQNCILLEEIYYKHDHSYILSNHKNHLYQLLLNLDHAHSLRISFSMPPFQYKHFLVFPVINHRIVFVNQTFLFTLLSIKHLSCLRKMKEPCNYCLAPNIH